MATGKFGHEDYETKRSEFIKLHPSITPYIPKRIYDNRDGSNFWAFIKSVSDKYKGRRLFINKSFTKLNDFMDGIGIEQSSTILNQRQTFQTYLKGFGKNRPKILQLSALGEITIDNLMGSGGNGLVYDATFSGESLAIKILVPIDESDTKPDRFIAEYFNIQKIDSKGFLVKNLNYDMIKFEGHCVPAIIMKKYSGSLGSFRDKIPKSAGEFLKLFKFLIESLGYVHTNGVVHRDVKPQNILIDDDANYVLGDFGIASYNPELFRIQAETKSSERIGNRLFSAPEQELADQVPDATMDIYALGQVLQWFATGEIHRGTSKADITNSIQGLDRLYETVVSKCLSHKPSDRFQSIQEITDFIDKNSEPDPRVAILLFDEICRSHFPKTENDIVHSVDKNRIDGFFQSLSDSTDNFRENLWYTYGLSNLSFSAYKRGDKRKFTNGNRGRGDKGTEYNIIEIWMHHSNLCYNDFVLIHYGPDVPFVVDGDSTYGACIINDKHIVSFTERESGYAEIDNEVIELKGNKFEWVNRKDKEGYVFIGPRFNCIINTHSDKVVDDFLEKLNDGLVVDSKILSDFACAISGNRDQCLIT
ncbi:MAG: serine/threonine-protein kinase [Candidatus Absconditabacterales bacterium]